MPSINLVMYYDKQSSCVLALHPTLEVSMHPKTAGFTLVRNVKRKSKTLNAQTRLLEKPRLIPSIFDIEKLL